MKQSVSKMISKKYSNVNKKNPQLLALIIQPDRQEEMDYTIDVLIFLLRYSFLLTDTPSDNNFLKRQISSPGEIFFQNSNGARYLDPKYSRWIQLCLDPIIHSV